MRALVTGAQGFVGRYVCAALLQDDFWTQVFGIGRSVPVPYSFSHTPTDTGLRAPLPNGFLATLSDPRFRYEPLNILDGASLARLISDIQPDHILHLASGLRGDADDALIETNVQGTATLLHAIATARLAVSPRIVIGSTGGAYGRISVDRLPLTEITPCEPADVYAATKLAAEHIARIIGRSHKIPVIVARIFNIVGPGQDERHVAGRFARELHMHALTRVPFNVSQLDTTRDFIDVRDVASALLLLAKRAEPDSVYNVASGVETHIRTLLNHLVRCSGFDEACYIHARSERGGDVPRHWADVSALCALGFTPQIPLEQSVSDLFYYYDALKRTKQVK